MFELHTEAHGLKERSSTLGQLVNYYAGYRRTLKKMGQHLHRMWFVDTNATESYWAKNPNPRKPAVFVRSPSHFPTRRQTYDPKRGYVSVSRFSYQAV